MCVSSRAPTRTTSSRRHSRHAAALCAARANSTAAFRACRQRRARCNGAEHCGGRLPQGQFIERGAWISRAGARAQASDSPEEIRAADAVVLPGVGSFYDAIAFMKNRARPSGCLTPLARVRRFGHLPGVAAAFERGDEGVPEDAPAALAEDAMGSNLAPAEVFEASSKRWARGWACFPARVRVWNRRASKVPHVGWDQVHLTDNGRACELLRDSSRRREHVLFTHSYAVDADACAADVAAHTHYTRSFPCVVARGNVFGCQFHPEKSSSRGLDILKNFVAIAAAEQKGGRA